MMSESQVLKGHKYNVKHSGVVTVVGTPYYIPGGWVVDVTSELPHLDTPYRWTACLCNFEGEVAQ